MIGEIFPFIDAIKANKKIKKRIDTQEIEIPEKLSDIDIKYLEEDYKNTVDAKNRFEDKAKTIIAALTISITLILNLSKIIETISAKFKHPIVDFLILALATLAIIYMLMAGIMSIQVLIKENILFPIPLPERNKQDKKSFYLKTQLNINQNLIRNNIIYSAYRSIRNSVFCLVVIFVLAILPFQTSHGIVNKNADEYKDISFGIDAVNWLSANSKRDISFKKIIEKYEEVSGDNGTKNIYDKENGIIVIIRIEDDLYIIDEIISNIEEIE